MSRKPNHLQDKGQGLVEYALIMVLVSVVVIVVLSLLGPSISNVYCQVLAGLGDGCSSGADLSLEQDFGSTQWKNGFDTGTPINNYCASEGSGANYNLYSVDGGSYTYYVASGFPWSDSAYTFTNTGTCP
jgi:pilus assembly protein Flp/PilA